MYCLAESSQYGNGHCAVVVELNELRKCCHDRGCCRDIACIDCWKGLCNARGGNMR